MNQPGQEQKHIPKVSIGMPVYNCERFVDEAIGSLLSQTYTDFELIISDNASTDRTGEICRAYAERDARVRYIRQEENIGPSRNFIFVLEHAVGNYFMWAAGDDIWASNWIEELVREIPPECVAIRGKVVFFNHEGEYTLSPTSFLKGQYIKCFLENEMLARCHHIYGLFIREKLLQSNLDILHIEYAADVIFTCHLLSFGDLKTIETTQHRYRHHDESLGSAQAAPLKDWKRRVYRANPLSFYVAHVKSVPFPHSVYLAMVVPIKHVKAQFELWYFGICKYVLGRNYQEKN
jgi:glycosyltransferase involved in cell wall biosynthesis